MLTRPFQILAVVSVLGVTAWQDPPASAVEPLVPNGLQVPRKPRVGAAGRTPPDCGTMLARCESPSG